MKLSLPALSLSLILTLPVLGGGCHSKGTQPAFVISDVAAAPNLEIRNITVGMTRAQILAAASAAGMRVASNVPAQLKLLDPTASGRPTGNDSGPGGHGLIITANMAADKAIMIFLQEQGDINGYLFEDIQKKWGKPTGQNENREPMWGDRKGVWAIYDNNLYGNMGMHVQIVDQKAFDATNRAPKRPGVSM